MSVNTPHVNYEAFMCLKTKGVNTWLNELINCVKIVCSRMLSGGDIEVIWLQCSLFIA